MPINSVHVNTLQELLDELKKLTPEQLDQEISFKDSSKDFTIIGLGVCTLHDEAYFEIKADIVK